MSYNNTNSPLHFDGIFTSRQVTDQGTKTEDGSTRSLQKHNADLDSQNKRLHLLNYDLEKKVAEQQRRTCQKCAENDTAIRDLNVSVQSYRDRCLSLQKQINDLKNNKITVDKLTDFVIPNQDYQVIKALLKENQDLSSYISQFNRTKDMHDKITLNLTPAEANHEISRLELDNKILRDRLGMSEEEEPCYTLLSNLDKETGISNTVAKLESQLEIVSDINKKLKQALGDINKYSGPRIQPLPPSAYDTNNLKQELDNARRELHALSAILADKDKEIHNLKASLLQNQPPIRQPSGERYRATPPVPVMNYPPYMPPNIQYPTPPTSIPYQPTHGMHTNIGNINKYPGSGGYNTKNLPDKY